MRVCACAAESTEKKKTLGLSAEYRWRVVVSQKVITLTVCFAPEELHFTVSTPLLCSSFIRQRWASKASKLLTTAALPYKTKLADLRGEAVF